MAFKKNIVEIGDTYRDTDDDVNDYVVVEIGKIKTERGYKVKLRAIKHANIKLNCFIDGWGNIYKIRKSAIHKLTGV